MKQVFALLVAVNVWAQEPTRTEQIQKAREEKAKSLSQEDPVSGAERRLAIIKEQKILERITAGVAGFRAKFGGLATGSGFAIGPEYYRQDLASGNLMFRASARSSLRAWQLHDVEMTAPRLAGGRVVLNFLAQYRNFGGLNYYGPGPDSSKNGRSNFRLEDISFDGSAKVRLGGAFWAGASGGYLRVNVGPGTDDRFVSSERIYSPISTPGIDRQTDFLRTSGTLQFDTRDNPLGPRKGTNIYAMVTNFSDRGLGVHDFRRLDMEVQQYIPFFLERRVIAFRAKSSTTYASNLNRVPFYLQPTVGGSDDLRGFRPFRFYDDNSMVFNLEYRWESFTGLDMALFADAGKVASKRNRWNLKDLEASYGFGFRFNVRNSVFMRLDFGFSHEGFQAWVKFNNVF